MDFIGNQMVQGPNEWFSAASKGFKRLRERFEICEHIAGQGRRNSPWI